MGVLPGTTILIHSIMVAVDRRGGWIGCHFGEVALKKGKRSLDSFLRRDSNPQLSD